MLRSIFRKPTSNVESLLRLPQSAAPPTVAPGWYWVLPRVALVLFLAAIAALVWLLHSKDQEDQRAALISDVLWMEQDLRFHLDRM